MTRLVADRRGLPLACGPSPKCTARSRRSVGKYCLQRTEALLSPSSWVSEAKRLYRRAQGPPTRGATHRARNDAASCAPRSPKRALGSHGSRPRIRVPNPVTTRLVPLARATRRLERLRRQIEPESITPASASSGCSASVPNAAVTRATWANDPPRPETGPHTKPVSSTGQLRCGREIEVDSDACRPRSVGTQRVPATSGTNSRRRQSPPCLARRGRAISRKNDLATGRR
jgi:hypothetical protein